MQVPTRRQFLAFAGSSLAIAPILAKARVLPAADSVDPLTPNSLESPSSTIATLSDSGQRLTVAVHIDGKGPYQFLVDTGADRSVVAAEVAAAIGLPAGDPVALRGVVRSIAANTVLIEDLSCGPIRCRNVHMPTLPAALLGADGYLGLDALDRHRVVFNFKEHTLQVTEPRPRIGALWVASSEVRVRAIGTLGHLRAVNCVVDGVAAAAFIDTGAEVSAGNSALLTALMNRPIRHEPLDRVSLTDVTGGSISGSAMSVRSIQLSEVTFTNCPLVVADFEVFNVWGLRDRPALLLGVNILRQFSRVSIDYGLKEIRFDLTSSIHLDQRQWHAANS